MAIVKMKRLTLLAMKTDKDTIFNALVKSNAVQLKRSEELPCCSREVQSATLEKLLEKVKRVDEAIAFLTEQTARFNATNKRNKEVSKAEIPKNSFARPLTEIDYDCFLDFGKNVQEIEASLGNLAELRDRLSSLEAQLLKNGAEQAKLALYAELAHPTTWYRNTETTIVQLSQMPSSEWEGLQALAKEFDTVSLEKVAELQGTALVVVVAHKSQKAFLEQAVSFGLVKSNVQCEILPRLILKDLVVEGENIKKQIAETQKQIVAYDKDVLQWQVYVDYLNLCAKKAEADGELQNTAETFVLEGYYPAEQEERVEVLLRSLGDCMVLHFDEIGEEEFAPTLTKNNGVVKQFEFVTNMYTPPDYHEIDPNPVMSVFYFLIFGFMVADIGYGLLLCLAGLFATFAIKQRTGLKTMLQMFGICGISAVLVGVLFGSCFSYQLLPGLIPNPSEYPMVMIILSILLGVTHVMAGIGCKMAVKIKHKQTLAAWLADFPWLLVFVGLVLAIWNSALDMAAYEPYQAMRLPDIVSQIGLYVCLGSLVLALVFAGVGTKGVKGKIMKSFGSAYGIINYFSDVMSYIRVFGLMLSSALIGSVVNMLGEMVAGGGGVGYVFAALVLVLAHLFNLVMGCLSVYIHNGRLQYVEFFGKFYTGDGQLFVPFGSDTKYTLITDAKQSKANSANAV